MNEHFLTLLSGSYTTVWCFHCSPLLAETIQSAPSQPAPVSACSWTPLGTWCLRTARRPPEESLPSLCPVPVPVPGTAPNAENSQASHLTAVFSSADCFFSADCILKCERDRRAFTERAVVLLVCCMPGGLGGHFGQTHGVSILTSYLWLLFSFLLLLKF